MILQKMTFVKIKDYIHEEHTNLKTSHWMEFIHPMAIIKTNDYVQTIFNY